MHQPYPIIMDFSPQLFCPQPQHNSFYDDPEPGEALPISGSFRLPSAEPPHTSASPQTQSP